MGEHRGAIARIFEWLILSWTALIPLMIWFHLRFAGRYTLPAADFVFLAAFPAFAIGLFTGALKWRTSSWYRPLLAYAGALILSTLASQDIRHSAPKLAGDLYLIVAAVLTVNYVTNQENLRRIIFAWITGAAMTIIGAVAGVALFFSGATMPKRNPFLFQFGSLPPGHYPRIRSLFLNANMMCSYMIAATMIVIAARRAGWISQRVFRWLFVGCITTTSFSLSPVLGGLFLALGLWWTHEPTPTPRGRLFQIAGFSGAILFVAVAMISPTPLARTNLVEALIHAEPSARVQTWIGAFHTFTDNPWLGQGLESEAADVHYQTASGAVHHNTDAQNTWLSVLAQQGAIGFLALVWVTGHLVRRFRRRSSADSNAAVRAGIELAMICGFLFATLSGSFENTRHVWALLGLVAAVQELPGLSGTNDQSRLIRLAT